MLLRESHFGVLPHAIAADGEQISIICWHDSHVEDYTINAFSWNVWLQGQSMTRSQAVLGLQGGFHEGLAFA